MSTPKFYIGVDLGGTNMRCVVTDAVAKVLSRSSEPTKANLGVYSVLERMGERLLNTVKDAGLKPSDIVAGAIAVPGPVDSRAGVIHSAPNMPNWNGIPVSAWMTETTGIPFYLENDANAAAWGEFWVGEAANHRGNMVLLTVGTGIGGAVIVEGRLLEGANGTAGELGHICVKEHGRPCGCGANGCVEAYASATAIVQRFKKHLTRGWESPLSESTDKIDCAGIFAAAQAGDTLAKHIVARTGYYLGVAAATLANVLNPECCLVAGGVAQAGDALLEPMRQECRRRCYTPGKNMEIIPASLGADAGLFGAAGRALERSGQR